MLYKIAETFYSLKGEGMHTGQPMTFIRLAGCNLNCPWCDTDWSKRKEMTSDELLHVCNQYPTSTVCITGGEPLMQDLRDLTFLLHFHGYRIHLETNGTFPPEGRFDWIAVSPKHPRLNPSICAVANEAKWVIKTSEDFKLTQETEHLFPSTAKRYLMPRANGRQLDQKAINQTMALCLRHPKFSFCYQLHKQLEIK